jgi:hypothetical protein
MDYEFGLCVNESSLTGSILHRSVSIEVERSAERRIIFERCKIEYIRWCIFRTSFKFCMGDKIREDMEGEKRDERNHAIIILDLKKRF